MEACGRDRVSPRRSDLECERGREGVLVDRLLRGSVDGWGRRRVELDRSETEISHLTSAAVSVPAGELRDHAVPARLGVRAAAGACQVIIL